MKRFLSLLAVAALTGTAFAADVDYKKEKEIPLPGKGGFDYVACDSAAHRLYVAHGNKIDVVDLVSGAVVGSVEGVEGAHGTVIVPELKRGFATGGKKKKLIAFELETLKVTKEVDTGEGPDALIYVTTTKEVWTMNHRAGTITCVDAASLEVKATIDVGRDWPAPKGQAGGAALESAAEWVAKGRVFVNVENRGAIVSVDAKEHKVLDRFSLDPAKEPTGLAIDQKTGILFAGCGAGPEDIGQIACMDAATGKVVTMFPIGKGCDAAAFDPETGLIFASCSDGTTTVVKEGADGKLTVAGKIETAKGGRTCTLDPKTHKLYVCAGSKGKDDVRVVVFAPGK